MSLRQIHTDTDGKLVIDLPETLRGKRLLVTVEDAPKKLSRAAKNRLMRQASTDPRIQRDVCEVTEDFGHTDSELP